MYILGMDYRYLGKDSPLVAQRKITYNFEWAESYGNEDMYYTGRTLFECAGGVIFGLEMTVSGKYISVSSGVAVINDIVKEVSSFNIGVKSNTSGYILLTFTETGYKYYCGNVSDLPSGYSYIILGSYTDTNGTVTVSESSRMKSTPILKSSITGTEEVAVGAHETKIVEIDHSSTGEFEIPGYITTTMSNGYYYGSVPLQSGYSYASNFITDVTQRENATPSTFRLEVTNTTSSPSTALITWVRSGIMRVNHT